MQTNLKTVDVIQVRKRPKPAIPFIVLSKLLLRFDKISLTECHVFKYVLYTHIVKREGMPNHVQPAPKRMVSDDDDEIVEDVIIGAGFTVGLAVGALVSVPAPSGTPSNIGGWTSDTDPGPDVIFTIKRPVDNGLSNIAVV